MCMCVWWVCVCVCVLKGHDLLRVHVCLWKVDSLLWGTVNVLTPAAEQDEHPRPMKQRGEKASSSPPQRQLVEQINQRRQANISSF